MDTGIKLKQYLDSSGIRYNFLQNKISLSQCKLSLSLNGKRKLLADEFLEIVTALNIDPKIFTKKESSLVAKQTLDSSSNN